ncbi:ATP-dependent RNA helicase [Tubulinosema ratisbonensis]|uniref:RNA helicase n=1 Tax=Tubulinosema ratisbonensis TaxID=291195 RepID=A0A437ALN7_9MICR|nr:ATP-dependent RNA helicase [Tubulinosema ratisbonensis]
MTANEQILKKILKKHKIEKINDLQKKTFFPIKEGKNTLIISQTGTGKTLSFLLPMLTRFLEKENSKFLIISPTRELSLQIKNVIFMFKKLNLKMTLLIGGLSYEDQVKELKINNRIIIGTLGRIKEHYEKGWMFNSAEMIILDEIDKLLENNFKKDLEMILSNFNPSTQLVCATATYSDTIKEFLGEREFIHINMIESDIPKLIEHKMIFIPQKCKESGLAKLIELFNDKKIIVFFSSCHKVKLYKKIFDFLEIEVTQIYGEMDQKERFKAVEEYQKTKKMFSTDLMARGIDFDVDIVIHFDLPKKPNVYVHRSGRTGRNNKTGQVYSIVTQYDIDKVIEFEKELNIKIYKEKLNIEELKENQEKLEIYKIKANQNLKEEK